MNRELDIEQKIACDILRYLQGHPDAKDTLEGVAQWWLLNEGAEKTIADVERAISILLVEDLIVATYREGLPKYYGLNQAKKVQVAEFLKLGCGSEEAGPDEHRDV